VRGQFPEESILFFPTQWIRLLCRALLHLDQRRRIQPRHAVVMPPDSGGEIQDAPNAAQFLVDCPG
jgi:hypothetical protein